MAIENYLIISDLQIPFQAEKSLEFCLHLKKFFKVKNHQVYNVGDETDQYWGGMWPKSPEAAHTPNQELYDSIAILKQFYKAFPLMKLCLSNHGQRWMRKATQAEIPNQMMRRYEDVIEAPKGWQWKKQWLNNSRHPFIVEHGDDWGGQTPHVKAAMHNGMSTIMGHHHSKASITRIKTAHQEIYGAVIGSLIDFEAYAFEYARKASLKPVLGACIVLDHGKTPIFIPYE